MVPAIVLAAEMVAMVILLVCIVKSFLNSHKRKKDNDAPWNAVADRAIANRVDLRKFMQRIESCNYQCEAGPLVNNIAWHRLRYLLGVEVSTAADAITNTCSVCGEPIVWTGGLVREWQHTEETHEAIPTLEAQRGVQTTKHG